MSENIERILLSYQDKEYKEFHQKLMPTIDKDLIIGIRVPVLRKIAKQLKNTDEINCFMRELPHKYYEENNLHAFLIEEIKDFEECVDELEKFLPYINNWATCDSLRPKCFFKHKDRLLEKINIWLKSTHTYTVRFAIEALMVYFLDADFDKKYLEMVATVKSEEYYVNMMIAWYFATALAKQYEHSVVYLEKHRLLEWTHNKTIQKAVESYRIDKDKKKYLKSLKYKKI